jgi:hypothetical protein
MNLHFGAPNRIQSVADAVPLYGRKEFESATRSTVPMLDLLIHSRTVFEKIIGEIGFPMQYDLHLEYTVGPFGGRGKASHTDVMLTAGAESLAVEAKWTEPMYETIRDWLKKGGDQPANRDTVLNGWLDAIARRFGTPYPAAGFADATYQMLHRAASAAVAGERPRLAYFAFKPSPDGRAATADDIFRQLTSLWTLLGAPAAFPFHVVEIELEALPAFNALLKTKDEATAEAVCAALQGPASLFRFRQVRIRRVGAQSQPISIDLNRVLATTESS